MTALIWLVTITFLAGAALWLSGEVLKSLPVRDELAKGPSVDPGPYAKSDKLRLGLRILESIYCVKGSVSWARVFCIALILNVFLYNLVNFGSLGMVILQEMMKRGFPPDLLPKSFAQTMAISWRLIDVTDLSVWMSIILFFASAALVDLISVYVTLAFYRRALSKNSLWPIWLNLFLLLVVFYAIPYLYFDHKNKPFLAYLLTKDYLHFSLFGLPGAQMFLVQDSFAYREVIFADQRAFQLLGLLGPLSAIIPISIVLLSLPVSLLNSGRNKLKKLRTLAEGRNPDLLTRLGYALVVIAGAATGIIVLLK